MKKYLVLALVLVVFLMISCEGSPDLDKDDDDGYGLLNSTNSTMTVTDGELQNDQKQSVSYSLPAGSLKYNKRLLIDGDNTKYYKSLANYLSILAADIYDSVVVDVDDRVTVLPTDNKTIYRNLGFSCIEEATIPNVTHYLFASQRHEEEIGTYRVVFVTIQGTDGSTEQWISNFDVGFDGPDYNNKVSPDSHWVNKNNHRGFDIAANMVKEQLEDYLSRCNIGKNSNTILVFTGHSRGAAIANILGAEYELEGKCKTFTYTFATPATTTDTATASSVKTVFNILNTDDLVTVMPLPSWGFVHYGIDKTGSMKTYATDWQTKFGIKSYVSAGADEAIAAKGYLADFCPTGRADLYTIVDDAEHHFKTALQSTATEDEKNEFFAKLRNLGLDKFTDFPVYSVDNNRIVINICPGFVMQDLANLIGVNNKEGQMGALMFLIEYCTGLSEAYFDVVSGFVGAATTGGMRDSHAPSTYVLLTQKIN